MIQKEAPGVQTVAKAVDLWLFEGVLREESEKLQDRKLRIKLHPLKVWGNEPVEEITTFSKVSAEKKKEKDLEFKQKLNYDMNTCNNSLWCNKVSKFSHLHVPVDKNMAPLQQHMTNEMLLLMPSLSCMQI